MPYYPEINNLGDIARYHGQHRPDATAFVFKDRVTDYRTYNLNTNQIANGLLAADIAPQSRVAVMGKNSDWYYELLIGAAKADMVVVGINWRLAPPEVAYILNDAEAPVLFLEREFLPMYEAIKGELGHIKQVILLEDSDDQYPCFPQWRDAQSDADPDVEVKPDDVAVQMYTSGTTGHPKGVMVSHHAFYALNRVQAESGEPEEEWTTWTAEDVSLNAMPNFHIGGTGWALIGLYAGAKNVVLSEFTPAGCLQAIRDFGISKMFIVPAAMQFVLADPTCKDTDFSTLKYMVYGASPIPLPLLKKAMDVFQCGFIQLYGMTETIGYGTYLPAEDHDPNGNPRMRSAGKTRPGIEVEIKDNDGNPVPTGTIGEICIKSPSNMIGYWKRPDATESTLINGWVHTGDAGYKDEDGYVYVQDRIKDMVVSGGENVYPAEVESALFGMDAIADVAVIGVPDDKWGEAVKACVVLKPGAQATQDEIIAFAKQKIAGYKVPKSVDFMDVLPRNPSGKLLKRELRKPYWEGRERQVN
ncbi:fatty acid--CoA ligase [Ketobacter sp.]|uniref:fatty acid--CoA ligase n=1 Tax=Ketobacter sp. TaxID=2083498 RepID=UPI000F299625|nr:fatty acid--CoA ligase [Ketobacter sp.]RLT93988.1 MAG: fatty acid--CoA ligase [Ketobacter sp.]